MAKNTKFVSISTPLPKRQTKFFFSKQSTDFLRSNARRRFWILPTNDVNGCHNADLTQATINKIREHYSLPNAVSNDLICKVFKGTLAEASINMVIAKENLHKVFSKEIPRLVKKAFNIKGKYEK